MSTRATGTNSERGTEDGRWRRLGEISALLAASRVRKGAVTEQRRTLLAEMRGLVCSSIDHGEVLRALATVAVPAFADVCIVDEVGDDGQAQRLLVSFADKKKQRDLADRISRFGPRPGWHARVIGSGQSLLVPEIDDVLVQDVAHDEEHAEVLRAAGIKSVMAVPLHARGRLLGALMFAATSAKRRYSALDLALAEQIAQHTAVALDNARLHEEVQRATTSRQQLLTRVSHDFKNLINVMMWNLSALTDVPEGEDRRKSRKTLATMRRAVDHLSRLSEDLTNMADGRVVSSNKSGDDQQH